MEVIRKIFGELENNCYIIYDRDGGEAYIIDPGYEAAKIADLVIRRRFQVKGILATHYHDDHTGACEELRKKLNTKVFMNRRDAKRYKGTTDAYLKEGDILTLGDETFRVVETPGHTSGSISLLCPDSCFFFSGDTLFPTDTGYVVFETGSPEDMEKTIKKLDPLLTDDYMIWPGHEENVSMTFIRSHNKDYADYLKGIYPEHTSLSPESL